MGLIIRFADSSVPNKIVSLVFFAITFIVVAYSCRYHILGRRYNSLFSIVRKILLAAFLVFVFALGLTRWSSIQLYAKYISSFCAVSASLLIPLIPFQIIHFIKQKKMINETLKCLAENRLPNNTPTSILPRQKEVTCLEIPAFIQETKRELLKAGSSGSANLLIINKIPLAFGRKASKPVYVNKKVKYHGMFIITDKCAVFSCDEKGFVINLSNLSNVNVKKRCLALSCGNNTRMIHLVCPSKCDDIITTLLRTRNGFTTAD